ncbi:MAG: SMC-Scp complex subunit ScpB [Patescibacteria group bacterium]|nr:SMC-Scp complex subunit ScpB [Patescibacteria group bacterium]MDE2015829.1 SMC-Scp complex subunit ScpB [Patescibacteria group bacterium]MDE2227204.1 SMC-Scp complex subunit ScpB [Patescibacteria group bacterium]
MENLEKKLGELEALLFIHGEPLTFKKISAILDLKSEETGSLVGEFKNRLDGPERGLALVVDEDKVQLVTKSEFNKVAEDFIKEELSEDLSPASLEALALVAYFAPISRSRLEYLRGVNSSFILRSLLLRGLVERLPDPNRQNVYLYKPTFDLLKHLGMKTREELPDYAKFQELLKNFETNIALETAPTTVEQPLGEGLAPSVQAVELKESDVANPNKEN